MMFPKAETGKKIGENSKEGRLLREIESISKGLYIDKSRPRSSHSRPSSAQSLADGKAPLLDSKTKLDLSSEVAQSKEKKSIWNWKSLKAFSRSRRFNCCFSLQVHSIGGLPSNFNDLNLCVYWKRRDGELVTRPAKVKHGKAEFEEKLTQKCSVYGSRSGPHHSAKYEAKHFLLYAAVSRLPELDLGKHRVDLTRLLPLTLEELEEERSSGSWTTSFKLSGKAKGATMTVSFGYQVVGNSSSEPVKNQKVADVQSSKQNTIGVAKLVPTYGQADGKNAAIQSESLPSNLDQGAPPASHSLDNVKDLHEVVPASRSDDASSVDISHQKLDEERLDASAECKASAGSFVSNPDVLSVPGGQSVEKECEGSEFSVPGGQGVQKECEGSEFSVPGGQSVEKECEGSEFSVSGGQSIEKECEGSEVSLPGGQSIEKECEGSEFSVPGGQTVEKECEGLEFSLPGGQTVEKDCEGSEFTVPCGQSLKKDCEGSEFTVPSGQTLKKECEVLEFSVTEQGIELASKEEVIINHADVSGNEDSDIPVKSTVIENDTSLLVVLEEGVRGSSQEIDNTSVEEFLQQLDQNQKDEKSTKESLMEELDSALRIVEKLETSALDSPEHHSCNLENEDEFKKSRIIRSQSLDDVANLESEFLNMLGIEHSPSGPSSESEPDSPRERLLKEFERETLATGFPLFDFDMEDADWEEHGCDASTFSEWNDFSDDFELSSMIQAAEKEFEIAAQAAKSRETARLLEDLETEALMRQWGINEKAFQCSPPKGSDGFGSPIDLPPEDLVELPPLAEGLGPFIQTKNGGFLRSMNPELFTHARSGGSLIMQVSSPVVVPAVMGSSKMEILQRLASVGIEKLSMQANKLMPLDDITGKSLHQVAWEATPTAEEHKRLDRYPSLGEKEKNFDLSGLRSKRSTSGPMSNQMDTDFGSLQDLAPLAMDKIEALSLEGLRIQSGLSDEDAPSNISAASIGEVPTLHGKGVAVSGTLGLEGTAGLQLLDIKDNGDEIDGLMGLSLTLDDWMRFDSGEFDDGDEISEQTSKILAAHHAASLDIIRGGTKGEKRQRRSKASGRKCGLLGNNFTVALMVQLRDPLRNYEPVGTPMLSLIQVERVFMPPKPRVYRAVSEVKRNDNDEDKESVLKKEIKGSREEIKIPVEEYIPQYKITEVHMAGLKSEPGKKTWGKSTQQQSGSRWLLANGMGKNKKHPLMKAKVVSKTTAPMTTKVQPGDTLWSISSRIFGSRTKLKDFAEQNPQIRNPNIILPNENSR